MKGLENHFANLEQTLNYVDYVPYISSFSGMVRILSGIAEVVSATAFTALRFVYEFFSDKDRYSQTLRQGALYSAHGTCNILRGAIAMVPYANLTLLFHDNFVGRMNYPLEKIRRGVYPIMTAHLLVAH